MTYDKQTWADGSTGGTPITAARLGVIENGVAAAAAAVDAVEDRVAAVESTAADNAGYTFGTTFPAPTLGAPLFFNQNDNKLYAPNGTAWYSNGTAATGVTGGASAPQNFTAVINPDGTTSLAWNAVPSATAYTVREAIKSPGGVSGMPITTTTNTRSATTTSTTREYYVTATVGGVETAESTHITLYYPYGSSPGAGGGSTGGGGSTPASFLDIGTGWYANLGIGLPTGHVDIPYSDLIGGYSKEKYFYLNDAGTGVVCRVGMDGKTTSTNTHYARCESREKKSDGNTSAAWSVGTSGSHIFEWSYRLDHIQPNKPWCTIGQIHDASSDALALKWKGTNRNSLNLIAVFYDSDNPTALYTGYDTTAANPPTITCRVELVNGTVKIYVNGTLKVTSSAMSGKGSGHYWKLGVYPQSHSTYGGNESTSEYCQATFFSHTVTHSPSIG